MYLIRYYYLIYFLGGKEAEEARMGRYLCSSCEGTVDLESQFLSLDNS